MDMVEIPKGTPSADHTSWCVDEDGHYVLVLHAKDDRPIATATYSYEHWLETLGNLQRAEEHRNAP